MKKKLYKSVKDRKLTGVCGGIAEYFEVDSTIIRIGAVLLALPGGMGIIPYFILGLFIMPDKPADYTEKKDKEEREVLEAEKVEE